MFKKNVFILVIYRTFFKLSRNNPITSGLWQQNAEIHKALCELAVYLQMGVNIKSKQYISFTPHIAFYLILVMK